MAASEVIARNGNVKDLAGKRFCRLVVVAYAGKGHWRCRCDCGRERRVYTGNLRSGNTKSCGCYNLEVREKIFGWHGLTKTAEHRVWKGMKARCEHPSNHAYVDYGGRGIRVCKRWSSSFEAFLEDMGKRPSAKHTIDRIDNDGNYEPGNCRWATRAEQGRNKRNNVRITFQGETLCVGEWARRTGIDGGLIRFRLNCGWSKERALTTAPVRGRNRRNNVLLTHEGVTLHLSAWARCTGIGRATIQSRLERGWSAARALTTPVHGAAKVDN